jgi:hypothetical protein
MSLNTLEWIQAWYRSQCDGDWEHSFGLSINTLDNPGWHIIIELDGTGLEKKVFTPVKIDYTDDNWFHCLLKESKFEAAGGPCNLINILEVFRNWVIECENKKSELDISP